MPNVESHAPGNFCWVELGTTDQAGAKKFYQSLFGWEAADQPTGPGETYTMFKKGGQDAAAGLSAEARPERACRRTGRSTCGSRARTTPRPRRRTLGPRFWPSPSMSSTAGRMAVLQDPTGAVFAVWEARRNRGSV